MYSQSSKWHLSPVANYEAIGHRLFFTLELLMHIYCRVLSHLAISLALLLVFYFYFIIPGIFLMDKDIFNMIWWRMEMEVFFFFFFVWWHFDHWLASLHEHGICPSQIRIDGQDIREVTLESLRKSIGVVPQDTVSSIKWFHICFSCSSLLYMNI